MENTDNLRIETLDLAARGLVKTHFKTEKMDKLTDVFEGEFVLCHSYRTPLTLISQPWTRMPYRGVLSLICSEQTNL
jgi:hypothetical protein